LEDGLLFPTTFETVSRVACKLPIHILSGRGNIFCRYLRLFSVYLIALAHILNPKECEDLVFCGAAVNETADHSLAMQLEDWDGEESFMSDMMHG
jgi:hypothetical protein